MDEFQPGEGAEIDNSPVMLNEQVEQGCGTHMVDVRPDDSPNQDISVSMYSFVGGRISPENDRSVAGTAGESIRPLIQEPLGRHGGMECNAANNTAEARERCVSSLWMTDNRRLLWGG